MRKISFKQIFRLNFFFWSGWLFFNAFVMSYQVFDLYALFSALGSSLQLVLPLFGLSVGVWPVCRTIEWSGLIKWRFFVFHFLLANAFASLWIALLFALNNLLGSINIFFAREMPYSMDWLYPQGILIYIMISSVYYTVILYQEIMNREVRDPQFPSSSGDSAWERSVREEKP